MIFSGESAEIHKWNTGNFSRDKFWILRGYLGAYFTGNPQTFPVDFFVRILRIYSGTMQVNFTGGNPGNLWQKFRWFSTEILWIIRLSNSGFEGESLEIHHRFLMKSRGFAADKSSIIFWNLVWGITRQMLLIHGS